MLLVAHDRARAILAAKERLSAGGHRERVDVRDHRETARPHHAAERLEGSGKSLDVGEGERARQQVHAAVADGEVDEVGLNDGSVAQPSARTAGASVRPIAGEDAMASSSKMRSHAPGPGRRVDGDARRDAIEDREKRALLRHDQRVRVIVGRRPRGIPVVEPEDIELPGDERIGVSSPSSSERMAAIRSSASAGSP